MENWIFLVLGLILAYLLEFTRPWVRSTYDRRIFISKKKRITNLIKDYKLTEAFRGGGSFLNTGMLALVAALIFLLALLIGIVGFILVDGFNSSEPLSAMSSLVNKSIIIFFILLIGRIFYLIMDMGNRAFDTDNYKKKIIRKLEKLGVSAKELEAE